jgi:hypothetical protein
MNKTIWLLPGIMLLFVACTSSKITSTYEPQHAEKKQFYRVLVLGLAQDSDSQLQAKMEKHLAGDMKVLGYSVVTSLDEYGPRAFKGMTEKEALAKLKNSNIDAVVTIVLLNKKMEKQFVPAQKLPVDQNFSHLFWDYYGDINKRVFEPGYYFDNTEYYWESNVYEVNTQKLLYSVTTTSFNPSNTESLAHQYGKMIVRSMKKKQVIERDPQPVKKGF